MNFDEIKTKKFQNVLNNLNVNKALVVLEDGNTNAEISARNIAGVKTARTNTINVYDILKIQHSDRKRKLLLQQSRRCTHNGKHSVL